MHPAVFCSEIYFFGFRGSNVVELFLTVHDKFVGFGQHHAFTESNTLTCAVAAQKCSAEEKTVLSRNSSNV